MYVHLYNSTPILIKLFTYHREFIYTIIFWRIDIYTWDYLSSEIQNTADTDRVRIFSRNFLN